MRVRGANFAPPLRDPLRAGFTLVEILLVLAVMALISALVLPGLGRIFRTVDNQDPEQVLWDAVTAARKQALNAQRPVWLSFDREKRQLIWIGGKEAGTLAWPADASLQLLQATEGAAVLLGGRLRETQEISGVWFYADGTCDRFRAQLRSGQSAPRTIGVDPWTCARVVDAEARS